MLPQVPPGANVQYTNYQPVLVWSLFAFHKTFIKITHQAWIKLWSARVTLPLKPSGDARSGGCESVTTNSVDRWEEEKLVILDGGDLLPR